MKSSHQHRDELGQRWPGWLSWALLLLVPSCSMPPLQHVVFGPDYQPANVFKLSEQLPSDLRRVAVLPLIADERQTETIAGQQTLEPILHTELLKVKKFDLLWVSPEVLGQLTGRKSWAAEDTLPPTFFAKIREELGCDGVLFCRLSRYRAYPPLVIGWNLRLVEAQKAETVWSVDEIFDAGEPLVSNSARRYEQQHQKVGPVTDSPMILSAPSRFGQYTAAAVLSTLPAR